MKNMKLRLILLNFLEFAVWGAYLTSMGTYLATHGLATHIGWFYSIQGIVSLFMPALMGIVADRWVPAQKLLSICHALAGVFMIGAGVYGVLLGNDIQFGVLFALYTVSVAFYMPTIGLNNSVAFNALERNGLDTVKDFPPIRVFGTVGFIVAELLVNFVAIDGVTLQKSYTQFFATGAFGIIMALYALTMPKCPVNKSANGGIVDALGLRAFALFKTRRMAIFFIFSMLLGVSLQITNSYGTTFIESFSKVSEYSEGLLNGWFAHNPTFLISISQCSEALCILMIAFCLKRFGIKGVMLIAMFAWVLRFGFFGIGDTNFPGVVFLILSCIVYGVAFDFFNVSGGIYVDQQTDPKLRSSAQGLFMIMTNGIGASLGTFIAGEFVVNKYVMTQKVGTQGMIDGWHHSWFIFAAYALIVFVMFYLCFKAPKKHETKTVKDI